MQWDSSPNAGFTEPGVTPWLPVAEDYQSVNVAVEEQDPRSMLSLFRALTELRRREPALAVGGYASVTAPGPDVFAYVRSSDDGERFLVVLNFGSRKHQLDLSDIGRAGHIEVSTGMDRQGPVTLSDLELRGDEGVVIRLIS